MPLQKHKARQVLLASASRNEAIAERLMLAAGESNDLALSLELLECARRLREGAVSMRQAAEQLLPPANDSS
ncbi:MAG: hypothetical protein GAK45_02275 [Pseudomonas citronellolis]|nr:MAG: hypothetical protein GAK45_02275 [Pseudomonas citronellolis]